MYNGEDIRQRQAEMRNNITKGFVNSEDCLEKAEENDLEKAKSGVYANTSENRKLGRVGQKYGNDPKEDETKGGGGKKEESKILKL